MFALLVATLFGSQRSQQIEASNAQYFGYDGDGNNRVATSQNNAQHPINGVNAVMVTNNQSNNNIMPNNVNNTNNTCTIQGGEQIYYPNKNNHTMLLASPLLLNQQDNVIPQQQSHQKQQQQQQHIQQYSDTKKMDDYNQPSAPFSEESNLNESSFRTLPSSTTIHSPPPPPSLHEQHNSNCDTFNPITTTRLIGTNVFGTNYHFQQVEKNGIKVNSKTCSFGQIWIPESEALTGFICFKINSNSDANIKFGGLITAIGGRG